MLRFTKNLFSISPSNIIELDEIKYSISDKSNTDNFFVNESITCKVELFNDDSLNTILNSDRILVNKRNVETAYQDKWTPTDYSVYQAELLDDNNNVIFTGLVNLNKLEITKKTHITKMILYEPSAILSEVGSIKIGFYENNNYVAFYKDKTSFEVIDIAMNAISDFVKGDSLIYTFPFNQNYIAEDNVQYNDQSVYEDFTSFEYQCKLDFEEATGEVGTITHEGLGFEIEDGLLYLVAFVMVRDSYLQRDIYDYVINENIYYSRKKITITLGSEDTWFIIDDDWTLNEYLSSSNYSDNGSAEPLWHDIQSQRTWIDIFANTNESSASKVYSMSGSDIYFNYNGITLKGSFRGNSKIIPFEASYEELVDDDDETIGSKWHSISNLIRMGIYLIGVEMSCSSNGIIQFDKLTSFGNIVDIVDEDIIEHSIMRKSNVLDEVKIVEPFLSLGWVWVQNGIDDSPLSPLLSEILSFYRALLADNFEYVLKVEVINRGEINLSSKINILSEQYKVRSVNLDNDKFIYEIEAWRF